MLWTFFTWILDLSSLDIKTTCSNEQLWKVKFMVRHVLAQATGLPVNLIFRVIVYHTLCFQEENEKVARKRQEEQEIQKEMAQLKKEMEQDRRKKEEERRRFLSNFLSNKCMFCSTGCGFVIQLPYMSHLVHYYNKQYKHINIHLLRWCVGTSSFSETVSSILHW